MKNGLFKKWLAAALCVLALGSTAALAEPDSFGLGTGRNGALTVTTAGNIINSYAQVAAPLAPGDTQVPVGTCVGAAACFSAGDLVMVLQTTGIVPTPASGSATTLDLTNDPVGRWEFARLSAATGTTLTLSAPLLYSYAANVTQVIRVPEYTTVSLTSAGRITALPWNGGAGGVIALLATGTVSNAGQINANALGFRGGQYIDDTTSSLGCTGLDEAAALGAQKGEGIANVRYGASQTGRGNVANGAGGGVCFNAGGGGGGNYGAGGMGGRSDGSIDGARPVGGLGGSALVYSLLNHLSLGGGGGAGHGSDGTGVPGGRGGGAIFIRANQLTGTGTIQASGGGGGSSSTDGGSGGGAGGSLYLRFVGTAACNSVLANGGVGGTVNSGQVGPGGGGGGGRALFQAATGGTCNINLIGATFGNQQDPSATDGSAYGAKAGNNGIPVALTYGFIVPLVPTVVTPANGTVTSNRRPVISGKAQPNTLVIIYVDGNEVGRATSDAAGNYSVTPTTDLSEGNHTVQAAAEVDAVQSPKSTANTFTVDLTSPDTTIVSKPPSITSSTSATFDFNSNETGVTYECRLDGTSASAFIPCTDPVTFTGLAEKSHTLEVRARDAAGNVDLTPATYTWTVDLTPPDTVIVSGPPSVTNSTSATFDFDVAVAEAGVTYECRLDGAATFTSCTDPQTFTGLTDGNHTLQVRAVDSAGNVDLTPASYSWRVDTTAPDTVIASKPPSISNSASATFDFDVAVPEVGTVTYECRLDGAATFTPCSDPQTFTGLAEGSHTLEVRAIDAAGNVDSTPASYSWTVDTKAPETSFASMPPLVTSATSATFDFDSDETGVTYECRLDGTAAGPFGPCTDPETFTGLGDGSHKLEVRARDVAGNVDATPASYTWTVDTKAPETSFASTPPLASGSTSATFDFDSDETGVTYECRLDGTTAGPFGPCTDPETFTGLGDGSHTLEVRARDAAGNVDATPASYTWTVDTLAPETSFAAMPPMASSSASATFDFSSNETAVTYVCRLDAAMAFTPCTDPETFTGLGDGSHSLEVSAVDAAGNMDPTPAVYSWTVDTKAPGTSIVSGPPSSSNSASATFDFSSDETGVTYECSLDGAAFTPCTDPVTFTGLADGSHTLQVRAKDAAGNVDPTPATYGWTVDTHAPATPVVTGPAATVDTLTPVISGTAEPGSTVTVIIDGKVVGTVTADGSGNWSYTPTTPLSVGPHEVVASATDEAGNTSGSSSSHPFTVVQDTQAPETTITSGPSGTTPEHGATFEFGSDEPGVTYECSLDGAAYTPCTSPVSFTNLADGEHTFQVRARDAAGNVDATPDTRTWTVSAGNTGGGDIAFLGDGIGCSATGGDSSLVLMGLGTFLALARRRRR
ncbi:adventurous gliding motility protein AgmC [Archangium sp.]|uniref:adventurous gliding motility protein AgmC n=1 Tax=Archangium sp. TaxID=1872627 RepID=UPI00389ABB6B